MLIHTETISAAETAYLLRKNLGGVRSWVFFLADCIQSKTSYFGLTLLPCAYMKDGRASRPVYAVKEIRRFIELAKVKDPDAVNAPIKRKSLVIDTRKGYKLNKFDRTGEPISRLPQYTKQRSFTPNLRMAEYIQAVC